MKLDWYFDFISPFAYLQHCQFDRLPKAAEVQYKPILFAGLLNHWGNVGRLKSSQSGSSLTNIVIARQKKGDPF